jgi:hypothetical protein
MLIDENRNDNDILVFNKYTRNFVPYRINQKTGEIIITSDDVKDTDITCIVTTWNNIYLKNLNKRKK